MAILNSIILQMDNPQHMMDGWGNGYWGMFVMVLFWLLVIGVLVTLIWFLIRKGGESTGYLNSESSLEILKKRYARGEIDEEEFRRMKKEISD